MSQAITHNSFEWHMTRAHSRNLTVSIIMCRCRLYLLENFWSYKNPRENKSSFTQELLHIKSVCYMRKEIAEEEKFAKTTFDEPSSALCKWQRRKLMQKSFVDAL